MSIFLSKNLAFKQVLRIVIFLVAGVAALGNAPVKNVAADYSTSFPVAQNLAGRVAAVPPPPEDQPVYITAPQAGQYLRFNHLSGDRGLSQSTVRCILQDSQGFMWFGTEDGLNRFDGYRFVVYKYDSGDPAGLSSNEITALLEDRQGMIWIGTNGGGLNRLDPASGIFTRYQKDPQKPGNLPSNSILSLFESFDGTLWIGSRDGLIEYSPSMGTFHLYRNDPNDPQSLSGDMVSSVVEDFKGNLWVGTNQGLNRLDKERRQFVQYRSNPGVTGSLSSNQVTSLLVSGDGILWVGTNNGGLNRFEDKTGLFTHYLSDPGKPESISSNSISAMAESVSGLLWVGTSDHGLNQFDPRTGEFTRYTHDPTNPSSLSSDRVRSVYEGTAGVLWVGSSEAGLNQADWSSSFFKHYRSIPQEYNSLGANRVQALFEEASGNVWIGTDGGGLDYLIKDTGRYLHYKNVLGTNKSLSSNNVQVLYIDRTGVLWVGTERGLNRFDRRASSFTRYEFQFLDPYSLSSNNITAITGDKDGMLWIGTDNGLNRYDWRTGRFTRYISGSVQPVSPGEGSIQILYLDTSGMLWAGTYDGLVRLDPTTGLYTRYRNDPEDPNSLSDNRVLSIMEDYKGFLWIGTRSGLNRLDRSTAQFHRFRTQDGLPNDLIYGILEDSRGYLWLSTNNGICRFGPVTQTYKNFTIQDGLQSNEFIPGAYHKGSSGEFYYGGVNGFNAFTPERIKDNPFLPPVVLTSLTQGGEEIDSSAPVERLAMITLWWPKNYFEFEFAALNYIQPDSNQYAYRLENFEEGWNAVGSRRNGRYTNLPGGNYVLHIQGSNNDGVWNLEGVTLQVKVVPPFWENPLFQVGAILGLVLIVVGVYRLRVRDVERRNLMLELLVDERTREIEQRRKVAEGLRDVLVRINSNQSLEDSLNFIICQVNQLMHSQKTCLLEKKSSGGKIIVSAMKGDETGLFGSAYHATGQICPQEILDWINPLMEQEELLMLHNFSARVRSYTEAVRIMFADCNALLFVPVISDGQAYGGMLILFEEDRPLTREEIDILNSFADQAALAIGNAQLRLKAEELAIVTERNRLARDLHDAVTQTLFSASLISEALPALWENDQKEGRELLAELRQLTRGALAEMRTLLMELRPSAVADAKLEDLLNQLIEAAAGRTGIAVEKQIQCKCELPGDVHVSLYRIAQEALNNVVRHAKAHHVTLRLECSPGEAGPGFLLVKLEVIDDGRGFDLHKVSPGHFGLCNIRDRAQAIGAVLKIESTPGKGARIAVIWQGRASSHDG